MRAQCIKHVISSASELGQCSTVQAPNSMVLGSHSLGLCYKWSVNRCGHSIYSFAGIGTKCMDH